MSDCVNQAPYGDLWAAIEGCATLNADSGKICIASSDFVDNLGKCMEVDASSPYVEPTAVKIQVDAFRATEEANDQLCTVYGAHYGARNASLWISDISNGYCEVSKDCAEAIFEPIAGDVSTVPEADAAYTALCEKMRYVDGTDTFKCEAATQACAKHMEASCATDATAKAESILATKAVACESAWSVSPTAECLINPDIATSVLAANPCKEQEAAITLAQVNLEGSTEEAGDKTRCFVLQQAFAANMTNDIGWTADGNGGCKQAATCAEIDFSDNNTASISPALDATTACADLEDASNNECDGAQSATQCKEKEIPEVTCASQEFDTVKEALSDCGDVDPGSSKVCGMVKDLSAPDYAGALTKISCQEYENSGVMDTELPQNITMTSTETDSNQIVCLAAGQQNSSLTSTNAYIVDSGNTGCEEATSCDEIVFGNADGNWVYTKTGYNQTSFKEAFPCDSFKVGGVTCIDDDTAAYKCKAAATTGCGSITGVATLTAAVDECTAATVSDSTAKECRVAVDISGNTFGCEEADKATKMKAADVTVADDAKSNAMCAFMGYVYGADNVDAWIYKGTKCEAIVKDGSCTAVSWKDKDDSTLGTVSWSDLCKGIAHEGYTNESGDVGNVKCDYDSTATPAPTTCSSSIAIIAGAMTALLSMLI